MVWLTLASVTGNDALVAARWLLSAALVAVRLHVPLALITETVVPDTLHPLDSPASNVRAPVPLPPDAVAVPVVPYVTEAGPVTVRVAWVALFSVTGKGALVAAV